MSKIVNAPPLRKIPAEIAKLLGEPVLWRNENRDQYDAILLAVAISVGARDIVDWLWANDVTCLAVDARRLQVAKAALILSKQIQIVEELLKSTYDPKDAYTDTLYNISDARNEARRWATDPDFGARIDERLAARGHDGASILGKAYSLCAAELQGLDKSIADREFRRMAILREVQRRDDFLARRLEKTSQQIIDGEFSEAAE